MWACRLTAHAVNCHNQNCITEHYSKFCGSTLSLIVHYDVLLTPCIGPAGGAMRVRRDHRRRVLGDRGHAHRRHLPHTRLPLPHPRHHAFRRRLQKLRQRKYKVRSCRCLQSYTNLYAFGRPQQKLC